MKFSLSEKTPILIYRDAIDMRKSIDGLLMIVVTSLSMDPQSGHLYLFRNKSGDKVKGILWDGNGFLLVYKRLELGRFIFPKEIHENHYEIDSDLLQWLLKGFDFYRIKQNPELKTSHYY